MKIKMLRTTRATPDGFTVATYREGEIYDLSENLAELFVREGWAVLECGDASPPSQSADSSAHSKSETKNLGSAPENKKRKKPHDA